MNSQTRKNNAFVVLGTQRSGTTFIRHCLNSHPEVNCYGELFTRNYKANDSYYAFRVSDVGNRIKHYIARKGMVSKFLDKTYKKEPEMATGFKLMYSEISKFPPRFPMIIKHLESIEAKAIHIVRRNVLKTLISRETAKKRKQYHAKEEILAVKVSLPVSTLIQNLTKISSENKFWQTAFPKESYIRVDYEDFVENKENESKRLLNFLAVKEDIVLSSKNVKLNPDSVEDLIENYNEVVTILTGTEHEWCLYADREN